MSLFDESSPSENVNSRSVNKDNSDTSRPKAEASGLSQERRRPRGRPAARRNTRLADKHGGSSSDHRFEYPARKRERNSRYNLRNKCND